MTYSRAASTAIVAGLSLFAAVIGAAGIAYLASLGMHAPISFSLMINYFLTGGLFLVALVISFRCYPKALLWLERYFENAHDELVQNVERDTPRLLAIKIAVIAGASLFIELILIRWQANLFPVFALYKNYTLLACFCGLGIGYAKARERLVLPTALPLIAVTVGLMSVLRYKTSLDFQHSLFVVPVHEESYIGTLPVNEKLWLTNLLGLLPVCLMLAVSFIFNALALIPIGQYAGFLMNRTKPLLGYGANLIGSVVGVIVLFMLSAAWAGPVLWFGVAVASLTWPQISVASTRKGALASALACLLLTAWPFQPLNQIIYSPYQTIEVVPKTDGYVAVLAAGTYYQKINDLSLAAVERANNPIMRQMVGHYELPFRAAPMLAHVAVIGAGTGNDVAAALRMGAQKVEAVEIDPAIYMLGLSWHPEHPYRDPNVSIVINDARNFFRESKDTYDAIVYGVLDSHIVLSNGSNVRLDSFVYTKEGLREAYDHLEPGGILSVSFALQSKSMGQKIFDIFTALPEAGKPIATRTGYDNTGTTVFMVRKGGDVALPQPFATEHNMQDNTEVYLKDIAEPVDLPTDDWPFFYMARKSFPTTYVMSLGIIVLLSGLLLRSFLPGQKPERTLMPFFFLGSGFMLIETKAITELGLLYGNTWHVVGIAIVGVLLMSFLANTYCLRVTPRPLWWAWAGILLAVALGYAMAGGGVHGGFMKIIKTLVLVLPMFFSGIVFSSLLQKADNTAGAMAHNLAGAMLGGLLEYNAMHFGFASLYLVAIALYMLALFFARPKGPLVLAS